MSPRHDTFAYDSDDRKGADPYPDAEGCQNSAQGISWVKTYGVIGLDTLATIDEPDPVHNARLGQHGYDVSIAH